MTGPTNSRRPESSGQAQDAQASQQSDARQASGSQRIDPDQNKVQQREQWAKNAPTRGSSVQGPFQAAKGGPQGANQGGAPRGGSRVEPSHAHDQHKNDKSHR